MQSKYLTSINVVPPPNMEGVKIALGELVDINNIHPDALQTLEIVLKLAKSNDPIASNIIKLIFKMKVTQKYGFIDSFKNMLEKLSEPTNSLIDKLAEYGGITDGQWNLCKDLLFNDSKSAICNKYASPFRKVLKGCIPRVLMAKWYDWTVF